MGVTTETDAAADAAQDPLAAAITKQEELLRSMQQAHGEFHLSVSDDLAQLATLYNMRGDHERALTLLHKRLVIHEKHGPPERVGETLHELGTTYRLQGAPEMAQQHLERALATRTSSLGDKSAKVAETLNSLALLHQARSDNDAAEAFQLKSLHVLLESDEPVDMESEDVPWEVYKRLKQQRGPSTAANSLTLLRGTMRKCVADALSSTTDTDRGSVQEKSVAFFGAVAATQGTTVSPKRPPSPPHALGRSARSKSDSAMLKLRVERDAMDDLESRLSAVQPFDDDDDDDNGGAELRFTAASTDAVPSSPRLSPSGGAVPSLRRTPTPLLSPTLRTATVALSPRVHEPIQDTTALLARVESVKRRLVAGVPDMDMEIARLAGDVDRLPSTALELRALGETMVGLVREMHRLRARAEGDARQMPVLEGHLEKKSASIFRGFERRFFKVDAKTFVLSYHFNRDDFARGFAPRGGFPVARISKITVHGQPTRSNSSGGGAGPAAVTNGGAGWFYFDVVVDLSTRHNPHATRTYELRADSADARRYWVETLHFYKATAQATTATSPSGRPSTS